jgi:hypothetical protein
MSSNTTDLDRLKERLDRLEAENRWIKRAALAAVVLAGGLAALVWTSPGQAEALLAPGPVDASQLRLVDAAGKVRFSATLGSDDSVALALFRPNGQMAANLGVDKTGQPALFMWDDKKVMRLNVGIDAGWSYVNCWDANNQGRSTIGMDNNNIPYVAFYDAKKVVRVSMSADGTGNPSLLFRDAKGAMRTGLGIGDKDKATVFIMDPTGKEIFNPNK